MEEYQIELFLYRFIVAIQDPNLNNETAIETFKRELVSHVSSKSAKHKPDTNSIVADIIETLEIPLTARHDMEQKARLAQEHLREIFSLVYDKLDIKSVKDRALNGEQIET